MPRPARSPATATARRHRGHRRQRAPRPRAIGHTRAGRRGRRRRRRRSAPRRRGRVRPTRGRPCPTPTPRRAPPRADQRGACARATLDGGGAPPPTAVAPTPMATPPRLLPLSDEFPVRELRRDAGGAQQPTLGLGRRLRRRRVAAAHAPRRVGAGGVTASSDQSTCVRAAECPPQTATRCSPPPSRPPRERTRG